MKRSSQPRTTAELSKSLHERLNTYAVAASAAGVGMLALVQPAEAKIVYTPADITISGKTPLDLNHDGIKDFVFGTSYANSTSYFLQDLRVSPYGANQILGENRLPRALRAGVRIGSGAQHFSQLSTFMARVSFNSRNGHSRFKGHWANSGNGVKDRYLGLKILINGKVHYGWARLTVTITPSHQPQGKLTGYAYETIPNKAIIAGKTKGPEDEVGVGRPNSASLTTPASQPATLGLLAIGVSGVPIWRRESMGSQP
jgi:hypothetical protein